MTKDRLKLNTYPLTVSDWYPLFQPFLDHVSPTGWGEEFHDSPTVGRQLRINQHSTILRYRKRNILTSHRKFAILSIAMKIKGQPIHVPTPRRLAFAYSVAGWQSWSNAADCKSASGASTTAQGFESLTRRQLEISPTGSSNYRRGLASGLRQRQGSYAHCHSDACARRKQGQNDLPQLPNRNGEGGVLWKEQGSAMEVPAVPEAIRSATA
jgi:hypothetical protein